MEDRLKEESIGVPRESPCEWRSLAGKSWEKRAMHVCLLTPMVSKASLSQLFYPPTPSFSSPGEKCAPERGVDGQQCGERPVWEEICMEQGTEGLQNIWLCFYDAKSPCLFPGKMSFPSSRRMRFRLQIKTHLGILRNILEEGSWRGQIKIFAGKTW